MIHPPAPFLFRPPRGRLLASGAGLALALAMLPACTTTAPGLGLQVASASVSQTLCSAVFVTGRDADRAYREESRPIGAMWAVDWALRYEVDTARREVRTRVGSGYASRSVFREGMGCLLDHGEVPPPVPAEARAQGPALLPEIAPGPEPVTAADPALRAAIDAAFAPDWSLTKAVVVVHRGRVVGERYADDTKVDSAWHAHSVSKALTHALVGVLAQQGRLDPAPLDPLLRMTEGKARFTGYNGFDDASRMWTLERDMAAFAESRPQEVPPGTRWAYSDPAYMRASRAIRDAAGGSAADVLRLAHGQLFGPLGMTTMTLEFDATGTPVGASHFYGSARDWSRLGLLYLNDGVVGGRRLLPVGWAQQAATPTLGTGYGAGFWLNRAAQAPRLGFPWGLPGAPEDAYFGFGYLGQFLIVVPSRELVIVRFGLTHQTGGGRQQAGRLVADVIDALATKAAR